MRQVCYPLRDKQIGYTCEIVPTHVFFRSMILLKNFFLNCVSLENDFRCHESAWLVVGGESHRSAILCVHTLALELAREPWFRSCLGHSSPTSHPSYQHGFNLRESTIAWPKCYISIMAHTLFPSLPLPVMHARPCPKNNTRP